MLNAVWLITCGVLCVLLKMINGRPSKSYQGKVISLFLVIITVGVLIITTQYNGLRNPLHAFDSTHQTKGSSSADTVAVQDSKQKPTDNIQEQIRQQQQQHEVKQQENALNKKSEEIKTKTNVEKAESEAVEYFYGVVIDAGSTGSRVHAFKFRKTEPGKPFQLEDALFKLNHEGLSSFADEPAKGAESISKLLDEAKAYIPEKQWPETRLTLKATAGLRALPEKESNALLKEVEQLFNRSVFKVGPDAVTIMDGDEEGIFSWFTLNFLMGTLGDVGKMVGAMDLGGGSTQITFVTTSKDKNKPEFIEEMDIFGKKVALYTHSYLGLGLMAGRFQTLGGKEPASEEKGPFKTPCTAAGKTVVFSYQGEEFNVSGIDVPASTRFVECQKYTDNIVKSGNIDQPQEVHTLPFTIFSYYYDRAVSAKLIDESKGGAIKVQDFINAAKKECEFLQGNEFLCLDLTYISSLLTTGFNFSPQTEVSLRKKVDKFEISWALGAMFHLLQH